jgi:protein-S-isoprenylcysteine O-methyltransferase Ste14
MRGIVFGAASFFVVFWVDVAARKRIPFLKPLLWLVGAVLFVWGVADCLADPARVALPSAARVVGAVFGVLSALLLFYSLFIEIPFIAAYVRQGQPGAVVARGTYALCRHPGVLWFAGLLVSLFLADGSLRLLLAIPIWVGLDAAYVVAQDRVFFPLMFGAEYKAYQREVPMLVPTRRSIRRCARTIFRRDDAAPAGR